METEKELLDQVPDRHGHNDKTHSEDEVIPDIILELGIGVARKSWTRSGAT